MKTSIMKSNGVRDSTEKKVTQNWAVEYAKREMSKHRTTVTIDHPDKSVTTSKIADRSITRDKLSFDILSEIAKIPEFLYYDVEPVYLSECKESLGYRIPADIPINVLFKLENDTDGSLSEFRTHDDYYTPLSCKIPSGETRICILLKRASGGADPQNGYLFVLDDTDTQKLISKETSERKNADTVLGQRITAEATAHKSADVLDHPDKSVTTEKIADKAVSTEQIADYAVESAKIASDAVLTEHIKDKNITKAKLSADLTAILDKVKDATPSTGGLISSSDKAKLDGIAEGATKTVVDDALNGTSTNPLQNKVIATELKKKASVYNVSDFIGPDTYYRLPFNVGEYFILKNDGTEDVSKLLYGYNESWYNPSVYYWFSNTIKAGNTALCYMKQAVVDAGDIDGHDGEILTYELNESFAQILQNQSKITALQQHVTDREIFVMCDGDHDELKIQAALDTVATGGVVYPVTSNGDVVVLTNANTNKGYSPITTYDVVLKVDSNKTLDFRFCVGVMFDNTNPGNNQAIFQLSQYAEIKNLWTFFESSDTCTAESINPTVLYTADYCIVDNCNFDSIQGMNTTKASQYLFRVGQHCKFRNNILNGISLNDITGSQRGFDFGGDTVVENNLFQNITSSWTAAKVFYFSRCNVEKNTFNTFDLGGNTFYIDSSFTNNNLFFATNNTSFRLGGIVNGNRFQTITASEHDTTFLAYDSSNVVDNLFYAIKANNSYALVTVNSNATFSNKMSHITPPTNSRAIIDLYAGAILKENTVKIKDIISNSDVVIVADQEGDSLIKDNITNAASMGYIDSSSVFEGNITEFGIGV